jgi:hypothetical protein
MDTGTVVAPQHRNGRVPREFTGLARQLWRNLAADDQRLLGAIKAALLPIQEHCRRMPLVPPSMLRDLAMAWGRLPKLGYIGHCCDVKDNGIRCIDVRARSFRQQLAEWDQDEAAIAIVVLTVWFTPGRLSRRGEVLERPKIETLETVRATLSLHCLGRFYERALPRPDDAAVIKAASSLAAPIRPEDVCDENGEFAIAASGCDDGAWLGQLARDAAGARYLACRTFGIRRKPRTVLETRVPPQQGQGGLTIRDTLVTVVPKG